MENRIIIGAILRLKGQFATPPGFSDVAKELEQLGLMRFSEWPSGHWTITEAGHEFISEHATDN